MKEFICILLEITIIPILNGLLINLIYDKIKTTLKFGDWKSGHNLLPIRKNSFYYCIYFYKPLDVVLFYIYYTTYF